GLLAVGAPYGAERAMLRTSAHRLHRAPHVFVGRQQVPAGGLEFLGGDAAAFVHTQRRARLAIADGLAPGDVAIAAHDRVCLSALESLFGIKRRVDAAEDDPRAALARHAPDLVSAERVASVDADADHVPGHDVVGVEVLERLVADDGVAELGR